tara:strand:+ start:754 stop:987 length:234 start_codon:yes stop_codon:yes gene_type:complete
MGMKIVNSFKTYDNIDEYDDAMAEWHQTGFEISLLKDSESPEDYKEMMDAHMAEQPAMTEDIFFIAKRERGGEGIPF